jgi:uncharacterized protein YjcR
MNVKKIKKQYDAGMTQANIAKKNNITVPQLRYLIKKEQWPPRDRSQLHKGNKNAVGNKGGKGAKKNNKYAVTTGAYENVFNGVLSEEENEIFNNYNVDKKTELGNELKILLIRERRILSRIKKIQENSRDMHVARIEKVNSQSSRLSLKENKAETRTIAENNEDQIQRLEDALTRVQEAKRRCIDSLHKIEMDEKGNGDGGSGKSLADTIQEAYENRIKEEEASVDVK